MVNILITIFIDLSMHCQVKGWLYAGLDCDRIVNVFAGDDRMFSSCDMLDDATPNPEQIIWSDSWIVQVQLIPISTPYEHKSKESRKSSYRLLCMAVSYPHCQQNLLGAALSKTLNWHMKSDANQYSQEKRPTNFHCEKCASPAIGLFNHLWLH